MDQLSKISPRIRLGIARVVLGGAGPRLLGQAAVSLHPWEGWSCTLRRVITTLELIIVAGLILVLIVGQNVAVSRIRAVLRRRVRGGVSSFAQASIRPRMLGPTLLSDGRANCGAGYVVDVAYALHSTMPLVAGDGSRWQLRRRR